MIKRIMLLCFVGLMVSCKPTRSYVADIDTSYTQIGHWVKEDPEMNALISPYKNKLGEVMNVELAVSDFDMVKAQPNSSLGSWFVDTMADAAEDIYGKKIDFAVQNYGGIRVPGLSKGPILVSEIYEIMPFDNTLVILEMSTSDIQQLLDLIARRGGWPVSSNLAFTIQNNKASNITIQGKPLSPNKTYNVAIPNYIANGGDKAFFLKDLKREDNKKLLRDIMIDYLRDLPSDKKTITNTFKDRITKLK